MSEQKHSPLPWTKREHPDNNGILYLHDANDEEIAVFYNTATDNQENIEFILRACNSHSELLGACRHAHRIMSEICGKTDKEKLCIDVLGESIANAEGKE